MATVNQSYEADIERFARLLDERLDIVLANTASALHRRLVLATPYRTGRARASWNINAGEPDGEPAAEFSGNTGIDATDAEIEAANAFYDPIIAEKQQFEPPRRVDQISVANGVHYIDRLNAGSSRQAPAGFFQANVASADLILEREVARIAK